MPKVNRRTNQARFASTARWLDQKFSDSNDVSTDESFMDSDGNVIDFEEKFSLNEISDLVEICKGLVGTKNLSVLIYLSLRWLKLKWNVIDEFLKNIGLFTAQTSHKWAEFFIDGNYEEFSSEFRGGKRVSSFYDTFPEIEIDARAFCVQQCSKKSGEFKVSDLVKFIDERFFQITETKKIDGSQPVRSMTSCRVDLIGWGAKFDSNLQRPYFEGHERPDVVNHRQNFLSYFLKNKQCFYTVSDGDSPSWISPTQAPKRVLICRL